LTSFLLLSHFSAAEAAEVAGSTLKSHSSIKETQAELATDDARMAKEVAALISASRRGKAHFASQRNEAMAGQAAALAAAAASDPIRRHSIDQAYEDLSSNDARKAKIVASLIRSSPQVKGRAAATAAAFAAAPKMMAREAAALAAAEASAPQHRNSIDQAYHELASSDARKAKIVASLIWSSPQVKGRAAATAAASAAAPKALARQAAAQAAEAASSLTRRTSIDQIYDNLKSEGARMAKSVAALISTSPRVKGKAAAAAAAKAAATPKILARQAGALAAEAANTPRRRSSITLTQDELASIEAQHAKEVAWLIASSPTTKSRRSEIYSNQ
jgi:hypothetical protein